MGKDGEFKFHLVDWNMVSSLIESKRVRSEEHI